MKKWLLAIIVCASPVWTQAAEININLGGARIQTPGVVVTFGARDDRGYYWDGDRYRHPDYWRRHHGHRGEPYYTGQERRRAFRDHRDDYEHDRRRDYRDDRRDDEDRHCPPGQARKGRC